MNLIGLMPLRNEAWVCGLSMRVALKWCDSLVVLDHCSTDETPEIIEAVACENPGRVHIITERNPEWAEMSHRQRLLDEARRLGATHIGVIDGDEVLAGNLLPVIRTQIESLPPGGYVEVPMTCIWRGLEQYRTDGRIWANRVDLMLGFKDHPSLCWQKIGGYDHHHRQPFNGRCVFRGYGMSGGVLHLQWASWRRLVAKQRLYRAMERVKYPNKPVSEIAHLYSHAVDERGLTLAGTNPEWWAPYSGLKRHVDLDGEPWQEAECERLIERYGIEYFQGLDVAGEVYA